MADEDERAGRLVVRRVIRASREAVFAAWTDPDSMKHWMCPSSIVSADAQLDPRPGGSYRIVMKGPSGDHEHTGEYLTVERPSKLVFTWISNSTDNEPTVVTVELFERGDDCELVLTHERFVSPDVLRRHTGGWGQIAGRLDAYLAQR